jgi:hypothetical protein
LHARRLSRTGNRGSEYAWISRENYEAPRGWTDKPWAQWCIGIGVCLLLLWKW